MYFLCDASGFYSSAEKVMRPDLRNKPVVTLSNNDGCIVAVCPIAKKLGIKKFVPYFQVKDLIKKHGVVVTSSNYELTVGAGGGITPTLAKAASHAAKRIPGYNGVAVIDSE